MAANVIATMGASMGAFISENSMTGYPLIDTVLIANLIPIIMGYINQMTAFITWLTSMIGALIKDYLRWKIKNVTVGTELAVIHINTDHYLAGVCSHMLNDATVKPTYDKTPLWSAEAFIKDETNKAYEFELKHDVTHPDTRFVFNEKKTLTGSFCKSFKYGKYIIHIESHKITLVGRKKASDTPDYYTNLIVQFFNEQFGHQQYPYVYQVTTDGHLIEYILKNGMIVPNDDICNPLLQQKLLEMSSDTKETKMHVRCRTFSKHSDYDALFYYPDTLSKINVHSPETFVNLCKFLSIKYNGINIQNHNSYSCFVVCKHNVIYIGYKIPGNYGNNYSLNIISNEILTPAEHKQKVIQLLHSIHDNTTTTTDENTVKPKRNITLHKRVSKDWKDYQIAPRNFENIFIPNQLFTTIRKEMDDFIKKEKLYAEFQIPYKKGILLYGPPGTGKTTLVKCLAYEYQIDVYMIDVNDQEINDASIVDILQEIGQNAGTKILLFEDVDSAFANKEVLAGGTRENVEFVNVQRCNDSYALQCMTRGGNSGYVNPLSNMSQYPDMPISMPEDVGAEEVDTAAVRRAFAPKYKSVLSKKYLTYSGLLNALDGVLSNQVGVITIMTTNYLEKLGDALVRPGRIDKKFELRECNHEQLLRMTIGYIKKARKIDAEYYKDITDEYIETNAATFAKELTGEDGYARNFIRPCELQSYLLKYIDDLPMLFSNLGELLIPRE